MAGPREHVMAELAVHGDPDGWLDAGRSVSTLMGQLEAELSDADSTSGQGLGSAWYGPSAGAFAADWARRRSRYEDLVYHGQRAAQAIVSYGQSLADMAVQAARLESTWCSFGLHVLESGDGFMLPPGVESMLPHTQTSLRQALSESEADVKGLASDAVSAAEDLAVALGSSIAALEDFGFIGVGILANVLKENIEHPLPFVHDIAELVGPSLAFDAAIKSGWVERLESVADQGDLYASEAAKAALPDAEHAAALADTVSTATELARKIAPFGAVALTTAQVAVAVRRHGFRVGLEDNAGNMTDTAIAVGIIVLAPEAAVSIGPIVAVSIAAAGVGYTVQAIVNHRKAIGHFIESVF